MYNIRFYMNNRGFGFLALYDNAATVLQYSARTGSIGSDGSAHDMIPVQTYWIKDKPVATAEDNMHFTNPGNGWKVRLFKPEYTHLLIHPIQHGTLGCIGIMSTDALPLRDKISDILDTQREIPVEIVRTEN